MSAKDAGTLVGLLFLSRDLAHRAHLKAKGVGSDAAHRALGAFYDAVVDQADNFAELYQGCYLTLLDIPLMTANTEDMVKLLSDNITWIKANRNKVCDGDTCLANTLDDILALHYRTRYKLTYLK